MMVPALLKPRASFTVYTETSRNVPMYATDDLLWEGMLKMPDGQSPRSNRKLSISPTAPLGTRPLSPRPPITPRDSVASANKSQSLSQRPVGSLSPRSSIVQTVPRTLGPLSPRSFIAVELQSQISPPPTSEDVADDPKVHPAEKKLKSKFSFQATEFQIQLSPVTAKSDNTASFRANDIVANPMQSPKVVQEVSPDSSRSVGILRRYSTGNSLYTGK